MEPTTAPWPSQLTRLSHIAGSVARPLRPSPLSGTLVKSLARCLCDGTHVTDRGWRHVRLRGHSAHAPRAFRTFPERPNGVLAQASRGVPYRPAPRRKGLPCEGTQRAGRLIPLRARGLHHREAPPTVHGTVSERTQASEREVDQLAGGRITFQLVRALPERSARGRLVHVRRE